MPPSPAPPSRCRAQVNSGSWVLATRLLEALDRMPPAELAAIERDLLAAGGLAEEAIEQHTASWQPSDAGADGPAGATAAAGTRAEEGSDAAADAGAAFLAERPVLSLRQLRLHYLVCRCALAWLGHVLLPLCKLSRAQRLWLRFPVAENLAPLTLTLTPGVQGAGGAGRGGAARSWRRHRRVPSTGELRLDVPGG